MFLLFPRRTTSQNRIKSQFTFQYVSIISVFGSISHPFVFYLHSNMFLLFQKHNNLIERMVVDLHSNMFLLFRKAAKARREEKLNLHSNMFLLFLIN